MPAECISPRSLILYSRVNKYYMASLGVRMLKSPGYGKINTTLYAYVFRKSIHSRATASNGTAEISVYVHRTTGLIFWRLN